MTHSEVSIVAPGSAQAGQVVDVEVKIKNLVDYIIYATPVIRINGYVDEGSYETLVPGQTRSWHFSFTMPSESVTVVAESWCESYYFEWYLDASTSKVIRIPSLIEGLMPTLISVMMIVLMMKLIMKEVGRRV